MNCADPKKRLTEKVTATVEQKIRDAVTNRLMCFGLLKMVARCNIPQRLPSVRY